MNEFDRRWLAGMKLARQARALPEGAPEGFAARVLARRAALENTGGINVWIDAWIRLATRALAGACALLLVMVALEWRDSVRPTLGFPHVEHSVAQSFWIL